MTHLPITHLIMACSAGLRVVINAYQRLRRPWIKAHFFVMFALHSWLTGLNQLRMHVL